MTELEINKTICEARGLCWHEQLKPSQDWTGGAGFPFRCRKCKTPLNVGGKIINIPSYTSSWSDYGQALEWAINKIWWKDFEAYLILKRHILRTYLLNPLRGSNTLAEFIVEHPEYFKDI